jgi:hypothetical protein
MLKINGFIRRKSWKKESREKAERERERERELLADYSSALFVEEDIGHKKGTGRSGDSCFAIKSDLNSKPFPGTRRYHPAAPSRASLYFSSAPFRRLSFLSPLSAAAAPPSLFAITLKRSVEPCVLAPATFANKRIAKWAVKLLGRGGAGGGMRRRKNKRRKGNARAFPGSPLDLRLEFRADSPFRHPRVSGI